MEFRKEGSIFIHRLRDIKLCAGRIRQILRHPVHTQAKEIPDCKCIFLLKFYPAEMKYIRMTGEGSDLYVFMDHSPSEKEEKHIRIIIEYRISYVPAL